MTEINDYIFIDDIKIEIKSIIHKNSTLEPIVFLHEGLGSVALWKDFPKEIYNKTKRDVIIYSRLGMGNSSPLKLARKFDYMHQEALYYLPKILNSLKIANPILMGHSDGASIALIYAGNGNKVKSMLLEAPHVFVEDISIRGIKDAKKLWKNSNLKEKLSKINEFIQEENSGLEYLTNKRAGVEKEADEVGNIIYGQRDKISGIDKILAAEADKIKRFKESKSNSG